MNREESVLHHVFGRGFIANFRAHDSTNLRLDRHEQLSIGLLVARLSGLHPRREMGLAVFTRGWAGCLVCGQFHLRRRRLEGPMTEQCPVNIQWVRSPKKLDPTIDFGADAILHHNEASVPCLEADESGK